MADFAKLILDADTTGLKKGERDLKSMTNTAKRSAREVGASMQKLGLGLSAGVTLPLAFFGKQSAQAAIDAEEMGSAFDVVFGEMADDVRMWAEETGDALGRSTQEIQRGALAFQELFGKALDPASAAELSKEFAVLTQDLASFKNLSNEVAQQKLFSGLTGEAEPLRAVGVFINDAAVKAKALELGLGGVNGALTDQEKIVARAALINEQLATAQGDVLRTSGSTANQIKTAQAAFEELQVAIGEKLLPAITPLITGLAGIVDAFAKLPSGAQTTIVAIGALAAAAGPLLFAVGGIVAIAPALAAAFAAVGAAAAPIALTIGAVAAAGYLIYENWDLIAPILEKVRARFEEVLGPKVQALVSSLSGKLKELWDGPLGDAMRGAMRLFVEFQTTYYSVLGETFLRIIDSVIMASSGFFSAIVDGLTVISRLLQGDFSGAWRAFEGLVMGVKDTVFGVINALVPEVVAMGRDIISGLVAGIKAAPSKVYNALMDVVGNGVQRVKDFLGINSPSLLFMSFGQFITEGLAIGITNGTDMVGEAATTLAETTESANGRITKSFDQVSQGVLGSLRSIANGIKGGGFLGILDGVLGLFTQIGSTGLLGDNVKNFVSGARANGGQVSAGKPYLVGERGPELFMPRGSGNIVSNDNMGGGGQVVVINNSALADVYVDGRIQTAAPAIASGGAQLANVQSARMQKRSFR